MPNRQRTPEELAFNATVGNNIKYIRKLNNYTQARVGKALSCTFQQVQKYVVENAEQTPNHSAIHGTGHDGGEFLFFPKS